jgi:hypothetical protein
MFDSVRLAAIGIATGATMIGIGAVVIVGAIPFAIWLELSDWRIERQPGLGGRNGQP